jgi:hypothetical protein
MCSDSASGHGPIRKIFRFYYDGFKSMSSWGRKVWVIILIKLFIIFAVLKLFFFPDFLRNNFESEKERSEYVLDQLTPSHNLYD